MGKWLYTLYHLDDPKKAVIAIIEDQEAAEGEGAHWLQLLFVIIYLIKAKNQYLDNLFV